jgi:hypothetical protein
MMGTIVAEEPLQPNCLGLRCQLRVADVEPKPSGVSKIKGSITNIGIIEIDKRAGRAVKKYAIAGTWIAMTDDCVHANNFEAQGGVMKRT